MKKSFFKKLSFVLALAMIVSTIAPAAGAFAAAKPALSVTGKYLLLGESGKSSYDFNFKKSTLVKGCKYAWSSSKKSVATVNSVGLTKAVKPGTAYIYCKVTKAGKTLVTAKAKVVVLSNMKDLTITDPGKVAIDAATTLAYTYKTFSGATAGATSVVKWSVDSTTGAAITDKGVFTATAAGTYTVTAKAFSTSSTTAAKATGTLTIKVSPTIKSIAQYDTDTFKVTFDTDMSKSDLSATTASVYKMIGSSKISSTTEKISKVSYDTTGKIASIDLFAPFTGKTEYGFVYGELTDKFTSAEVKLDNVKSIEVADTKVDITSLTGTKFAANVVGKDANGVIIYTGADSDFVSHLGFTYKGDLGKGYVGVSGVDTAAYIYYDGYATTVEVKFTNYVLNSTTNSYDAVELPAVGNLIGYKPDTNVNTSTLQFILTSGSAPSAAAGTTDDWSKASFSLAANDNSVVAYARYKTNADANTWVSAASDKFEFTTSDSDKLLISGRLLTPVKAGEVTVVVKDAKDSNKPVVGAFTVVIGPARSFAGVAIESGYVAIGNNHDYAETASIVFSAKDSMNDAFEPTVNTWSVTNGPAGQTLVYDGASYDSNTKKETLKFRANDKTTGTYTVKVTFGGYSTTKDVSFNIVVGDGTTNTTVTGYTLALDKASFDNKNVGAVVDTAVDVYGINSNGYRVYKVTDDKFTVAATLGGTAVTSAAITESTTSTSSRIAYAYANGDGTFTPIAKGLYQVTATVVSGASVTGRAVGATIATAQMTVNDTTTYDIVKNATVVKKAGDVDTWQEYVAKAFTLKLNGNDIFTATGFSNYKYYYTDGSDVSKLKTGVDTTGTFYLDKVTVEYNHVVYTFTIGQSFTVN